MLRGWDEGYPVPSLGVAVRRTRQGSGLGREMMQALHRVARDRGAEGVRLRVALDNRHARHLYEAVGYRLIGVERDELLMVFELGGRSLRGAGLQSALASSSVPG